MSPSNDELSQGARANVAGKAYEDLLITLFQNYGFEVVKWSVWKRRGIPIEQSGRVAIQQFPYTTIYNHTGKTEWLIVNNDKNLVVRVEIKSQRSAGSVDEKLPYTYLNAIAYPEDEVVLLVEGDGFKPGARAWLKNAVETRWLIPDGSKKHIQMMNLSEFIQHFIAVLS